MILSYISALRSILIIFILCLFAVTVYAEDLFQKGIEQYRAENFEEALEIFKESFKKEPSTIKSFYLGLTYKQIGDYRKAKEYLERALTEKPRINDAYVEIIEILYYLEELGEAKKWLNEAERQEIFPAKIAYLKGLINLKEGKMQEARQNFEKAKSLDKNLTQPAEFQIALTYLTEKKIKEAKQSLEALIQIEPTTDIADFAKEYLTAVEKIKELKEWKINFTLGYLYDDNVVSKPSSEIGIQAVDAISGKRDSAVVTDFKISYTPQLSSSLYFSANYELYYKNYFKTYEYDMLINSLELIPGINFKNGTITLPVGYNHIWLNEREYMSVLYIKPSLYWQFIPGHVGQLFLGYSKRDLLQYIKGFDPNEDRDSNQYQLGVGYFYPFKEGKGLFYARYEYIYDDTEGRNWESDSHRIFTSLVYPVFEKLNMNISTDYTWQNYKNINTLSGRGINGFPSDPQKRKDKIWNISAGLNYELTKFLNLNLKYTHTTNNSNFTIYDYKRNIYSFELSFQF